MGPTSTAPSKTDVRKQTKWQQTGGGKKEEGEILYRSGMFSCSHAPQTGAISPRWAVYGLILPMTRLGL